MLFSNSIDASLTDWERFHQLAISSKLHLNWSNWKIPEHTTCMLHYLMGDLRHDLSTTHVVFFLIIIWLCGCRHICLQKKLSFTWSVEITIYKNIVFTVTLNALAICFPYVLCYSAGIIMKVNAKYAPVQQLFTTLPESMFLCIWVILILKWNTQLSSNFLNVLLAIFKIYFVFV